LIKQADPGDTGSFDKEGLFKIMEEKLKDCDTVEDLIEAFKRLDRNQQGKIPNPEFKQFMMTMGGKLPEEEVEEMIKEADFRGEGIVDIEEFAQMLVPPKELE
jgi:calmodulin